MALTASADTEAAANRARETDRKRILSITLLYVRNRYPRVQTWGVAKGNTMRTGGARVIVRSVSTLLGSVEGSSKSIVSVLD